MAYGIVQIKNSHLESWRLLFLIGEWGQLAAEVASQC